MLYIVSRVVEEGFDPDTSLGSLNFTQSGWQCAQSTRVCVCMSLRFVCVRCKLVP